MTVTAFSVTQETVPLKGPDETLVLQLRLPPTGKFVIWGKVLLTDDGKGVCTARLTTLDRATRLDFCESISSGIVCFSLQCTLDVSQSNANQVVALRCGVPPSGIEGDPVDGSAQFASLIAIQVDALSGPVAPPS
jgi:hypothetical protein